MNRICPVCSKGGIEDFTTQEISCPQCNSDLKPYYLIHQLRSQQVIGKKGNRSLWTLVGVLFAFIIFYISQYQSSSTKEKGYKASIAKLTDSLTMAKTAFINLSGGKEEEELSVYSLDYRVRKGDNLSQVAAWFYGDASKYRLIETDNSLKPPYVLQVGQSIIIKLPRK